jgi:YD repeat-containing protein
MRYRTRLISQRQLRPWARFWAPTIAASFTLSIAAAPARALASHGPGLSDLSQAVRDVQRHVSSLAALLMPAGHALSVAPDAGLAYNWEGSHGGTNTGNGNKLTTIPIVGWTAKGGLPVSMALYHNSQGSHNSELGHKWSHSFDVYLTPEANMSTGRTDMVVNWGNQLATKYTKEANGTFTPPAGVHDSLVANVVNNVVTSYDLTTHGQVKFHFTNPNTTGFHLSSIEDLNANTITVNRNTLDLVTSVVDPTSRTLTIAYDVNNRISTITDPASRVWTITYSSGNLYRVTHPTINSTNPYEQFAYNADHCITTHRDRRGNDRTYSWNSDKSLAWEKDPLLNQTSYTYALGTTTITDANGRTTKHFYSGGKLTGTEDALTNTESYVSDTDMNRTQVTDRRGKVFDYTFDGNGNCLTSTDPLSHTTTRTFNGFNQVLTSVTHLGYKVQNTYDVEGNLTQTQEKNSSGTVLSTTGYSVNADGTVASKTDDNSRTTSYGFNTDGHLTSVTTPNSRVTSWTVNGLGVRTGRTDAMSRTTSYTLDAWHRVTGIDYPAGTDPTFSYDANGNLTGWTDAQGTWARAYDAANRQTTESKGGTTEITYAWDATGKKGLLSSVTGADSRAITYSYTHRNEISTVVENSTTSTYGYDAAGNETSLTNGNGGTVARAFDDAGRLTSITNKNSGNTTLSSFSYSYNNDNLRTGCAENSGDTVSWGYSVNHRLTSESRTGTNSYSKSYTLDGVGNRTSQTVGGVSTSFTINSDDELTATSGGFTNSYSYNANGEQTGRTLSGTSHTLAYDYEGQLTSISVGGSTTASFEYDALGRRYSRTSGGTTTRFYYQGSKVLLEKQGSTFTGVYAYGNTLLRRGSEVPLFDGLGSERTVTNGSQTVTGTINFDAFGQTNATTGSSSSPYMFAATSGYRSDGDAGLQHVGARYYDPQVGRWFWRSVDKRAIAPLECIMGAPNAKCGKGARPVTLLYCGALLAK